MNKYIIPVCFIDDEIVKNEIIIAPSLNACQDKFMDRYVDYSTEYEYRQFIKDLKNNNIIVGKITDLEEL